MKYSKINVLAIFFTMALNITAAHAQISPGEIDQKCAPLRTAELEVRRVADQARIYDSDTAEQLIETFPGGDSSILEQQLRNIFRTDRDWDGIITTALYTARILYSLGGGAPTQVIGSSTSYSNNSFCQYSLNEIRSYLKDVAKNVYGPSRVEEWIQRFLSSRNSNAFSTSNYAQNCKQVENEMQSTLVRTRADLERFVESSLRELEQSCANSDAEKQQLIERAIAKFNQAAENFNRGTIAEDAANLFKTKFMSSYPSVHIFYYASSCGQKIFNTTIQPAASEALKNFAVLAKQANVSQCAVKPVIKGLKLTSVPTPPVNLPPTRIQPNYLNTHITITPNMQKYAK